MRRLKIAAAAIILLLLGTGKALAACDGADTSGENYCVYHGGIDSVVGGGLDGANFKLADSSANLYFGNITLPAACGNGLFDAGEQCDDSNTATGDGCSASCSIENGWNCTASPSVCTLNQYTLTVNATGSGSGTIGGGGIYAYGTTHDVTATADNGSTFSGWSGDCTGTASPLSVTILDRDMTCIATFMIVDSDSDGMADSWEIAHFGNLSRNGTGDLDGDGVSDYQEYLNGTDPVSCLWQEIDSTHLDACVNHALVLQKCLTEAQEDGKHNTIMVVQGLYKGHFVYKSSQNFDLSLYGGYTADCASFSSNPSLTILDGDTTGE